MNKFQKGFKKTWILICVMAITISSFSLIHSSAVSNSRLYNFENYPYTPEQGSGMSATGFSVLSNIGKGGGKALAYVPTLDRTNWTSLRIAALADKNQANSGVCTLDDNAMYRITVNYYLTSAPASAINASFWTTLKNGVMATTRLQQTMSNPLTVDQDTPVGQWLTYTATFIPSFYNDNSSYNILAIGMKCTVGDVSSFPNGFGVYFDDILVEKLSDDEVCTITGHYNSGSEQTIVMLGLKGDTLSLPVLSVPGYVFNGWYTDKNFTQSFEAKVFPDKNIDLYAKLAELDSSMRMFDFENYSFTPGGGGMSATGFQKVSDHGIHNSNALRYEPTADVVTWKSWRVASLRNAEGVYSLKKDTIYRVTISYYVSESPSDEVTVSMWSNMRNGAMAAQRIQQDMSEDLIIDKKTPVGKWNTYTATFTSKFYDNNAKYDTLTLGAKCASNTASGFAIYFDNIIVQEVPENEISTVTQHANDGTGNMTVVRGIKNSRFSPATPERKGYFFDGWYADADSTKPISDLSFPNDGNTDIYAKWRLFEIGDSIHVGFDDYPFASGSSRMNAKFSVDHTDSADGDSACVRADWLPGEEGLFILNYKNSPFVLEDGARYLVSFSYKNGSQQPTTWAANLYTTNPENCNSGWVWQSTQENAIRLRRTVSTTYGDWQRYTYDITVSLKNQNNTALALYLIMSSDVLVQGYDENNRFKLYFDDFTVTRIKDDDVTVITNTKSGPDYFIGKVGDTIELPLDLTLDGYRFMGWYSNAQLSDKITSIVLTENQQIYGNWVKTRFFQGFENYDYLGYGIGYDLDIELYNKETKSYQSGNVYSGTNSLHRIGELPYCKRFTLSDSANDKLQIGETYKITYYVRMGEHKTKTGSIQFAPINEYNYPATSDGDFFIDSISLEEISDGNWYRVTKVMPIYNQYLAMRTPESSDLYFDDFTIEWVAPDRVEKEKTNEVVRLGKTGLVSEEKQKSPQTGDATFLHYGCIVLSCACVLILLISGTTICHKRWEA